MWQFRPLQIPRWREFLLQGLKSNARRWRTLCLQKNYGARGAGLPSLGPSAGDASAGGPSPSSHSGVGGVCRSQRYGSPGSSVRFPTGLSPPSELSSAMAISRMRSPLSSASIDRPRRFRRGPRTLRLTEGRHSERSEESLPFARSPFHTPQGAA